MADNSRRTRDEARQLDTPVQVQPSVVLRHLNQIELARRWRVSPRTLERWRWQKVGPAYLKVGSHVVYRVEDVEAYETHRRTDSAA